jgi:cell division protein ZapA (FtsZ GTPase activity inhibitor)
MNESYKTTLIKIMGEEYPIKSDADSEYMQKLARYVEEKISSLSSKIKLPPHLKPEILAALLIADEYFGEKQKNAEMDRKLNTLMLVIEENF